MKQTPEAACRGTMRVGLLAGALIAMVQSLCAADYYLDPVNGLATNPGTEAAPWPSLEAVMASSTLRPLIHSGDTLHLSGGFHGTPLLKGSYSPANPVTIEPVEGQVPSVTHLEIRNTVGMVISGLEIGPENAGAGLYSKATLIDIIDNSPWQIASDITIKDCTLRGVVSIEGYTVDDWYARVPNGIKVNAPRVSVINNHIENVAFGVSFNQRSPFSVFSGNFMKAFYGDAIRCLGDDSVIENNWVQDSYINDANHDDFFQSWSVNGLPVYRVTVRNNTFISRTDPNQPLYATPQGIGCFDGWYEGWVVENNVIISDTYHGIAFYGANNCRIANNTVLNSPLAAAGSSVKPWVKIFAHKNGTLGTGNILRNNMASNGVSVGGQGVSSNNLTVTDYSGFYDYAGFDVRLRKTSPAVDAGTSTDAPALDIAGQSRVGATDIGAYEYQKLELYEGFDYEATATVSSAADSASDIGFKGTTWSGNNDIVSPGLSFGSLPQIGNALKIFSNVSSARSINMYPFPPEYLSLGSDSVTRLGAPGTSLWLAFLVRADATDPDGSKVASLNLLGAATGGTAKLYIGDVGTSGYWGIKKDSSHVALSSTPIVEGETVLLVARVTFVAGSGNDVVELFVNPTMGSTPPTTPDAVLTSTDIGTFDRVEFKGNRTATMDELVIVTDWDDL